MIRRSRDTEPAPVPASYVTRLLGMVEDRGQDPDLVLADTGWTRAQLDDPGLRITLDAATRAFTTAVEVTGDPSLGLELGLGLKASSHGWLSLALMTCPTLRDAMTLGERYMELRTSPWRMVLVVEGDVAILRFLDTIDVGAIRPVLLEILLGAVIRLGEFMLGFAFTHADIEYWSDCPELPHHARYRDQVPRVRYGCATNEARFPAAWLDRRLALHEAAANLEAVGVLERERRRLVADVDLLDRVRTLLGEPGGVPDLEAVARQLGVSGRTLRRHLAQRGTSFQRLREDASHARSLQLLDQPRLTLEAIAHELGYADASGFVRAFQRRTGETPASYRRRHGR